MKKIETIVRQRIKTELVQCGARQPSNAKIKVVSISDLHPPFHDPMVINHLMRNHSDADVLVINGDIFEVYDASKWLKTKQIPFEAEYRIISDFIAKVSNIFPKIILISGNHDARIKTAIAGSLPTDLLNLVKLDPVELISNGYTLDQYGNLEMTANLDNVFYNAGPTSWFSLVGRCMFAHPSNSSGVPMRTVRDCDTYFQNRNIDYDALVIGHSHKQGQIVHNGRLLIEQGCACYPMEYEASAKLTYRAPTVAGYAVVWMDKAGRVDFNRTHNVYLGSTTMLKNYSVGS